MVNQVGYLVNKSKNALDILQTLLENKFRAPKLADVVAGNLQIVKQDLAGVTEIPAFENDTQ